MKKAQYVKRTLTELGLSPSEGEGKEKLSHTFDKEDHYIPREEKRREDARVSYECQYPRPITLKPTHKHAVWTHQARPILTRNS